MAALVTGQEEGESTNDPDNIEKLRSRLKKEELTKLADAIQEVYGESLDALLEYSRRDIADLLVDIHDSKENNYSFKSFQRNKFAKIVESYSEKKKKNTASQSIPKVLFLGKDEEEAVEAIENGAKAIKDYQKNMKECSNSINDITEKLKCDLNDICEKMKQKIDKKKSVVLNIINNLHKMKTTQMNENSKITAKCANIICDTESAYPSYFSDNKLTKQERKAKLVDAKNRVNDQLDIIKKIEKIEFGVKLVFRENMFDDLLRESMSLEGSGVDLPLLELECVDNSVLKWNKPVIPKGLVNILDDNDEKSNNNNSDIVIEYEIMQKEGASNEEKESKSDDDDIQKFPWKIVGQTKNNEFDLQTLSLVGETNFAVKYKMDNIASSSISNIVKVEASPLMRLLSSDAKSHLTGCFDSSNFDVDKQMWFNSNGSNNHITKDCISGNIKKGIFDESLSKPQYISGGVHDGITLPESLWLKRPYTLIHVTRYQENGTRGRIFSEGTGNWFSGNHSNRSGVALRGGNWLTATSDLHGFNWVISVDQAGLYRSNGVDRTSKTLNCQQTIKLYINKFPNQPSDFGVGVFLTFDVELDIKQIEVIEKYLMQIYSVN